jgi:hypothetical protein
MLPQDALISLGLYMQFRYLLALRLELELLLTKVLLKARDPGSILVQDGESLGISLLVNC